MIQRHKSKIESSLRQMFSADPRGRRAGLSAMIIAIAAATASASSATTALAATGGVAMTSVNMRAGPGTQYPVVTVLPTNGSFPIHGCLANGSWCDIGWGGDRGWVSASYINVMYNGQSTVLNAAIVPVVGITTVTFSITYWNTHYHSKHWHGHWDRYHHYTSRKVAAGCNDNACGAVAVTRGPHSGRVAAVGASDGKVGAAAATRGPNGGGRAAVGGCGPERCGGASVTRGPRGNTVFRHGSIERR